MKKLFLFLSVFALLFSCEPEMVQPQKKGNVQNPNGDVGSANAVMQSVLPEAIYISKYSQLFAVDATTGDSYVLVPDNANYAAMASPNNGYIYGTRPLTPAPDDNYLFKVDPLNENSFED